jgi:hypothetical protein
VAKYYKQAILVFLLALIIHSPNIFGEENTNKTLDYSKGPLYGRTMFIPLLIHYGFPSLPAKSGTPFAFNYHVSFYYSQDVHYKGKVPARDSDGNILREYNKDYIIRDDESFVGELGLSFTPLNKLQTGFDMRLVSFYEGFLDSAIEYFHGLFGFPNAGRGLFLQNQIYVNIPNNNGISLFLDKPAVAFGDIDLWGKWTFFEDKTISLAGMGAFKIPTGRLETLSGSNYPDMGLELLADMRLLWWLTCYGQAGVVFPLNGKSFAMFNGLACLEFNMSAFFSFLVQMNIKTSPLSSNVKRYTLPQTNMLAGFKFRRRGYTWQFYVEENAFTAQGTDITINLMFLQELF